MDDCQCECGGDRGVDGRAAVLDHIGADAGRNLVLRSNDPVFGTERNRAGADGRGDQRAERDDKDEPFHFSPL